MLSPDYTELIYMEKKKKYLELLKNKIMKEIHYALIAPRLVIVLLLY